MQSNRNNLEMKSGEKLGDGMKIRTWGALVDNDDSVWLPVLNTNCLLKSAKHGWYEYIGELMFCDKKKDNCILKVLEHDNRIFFFLKADFEVCILDKDSLTMTFVNYGIGQKKGIADVVKADKYAVVLTSSVKEPAVVFDMDRLESELYSVNDGPRYEESGFIRGVYQDTSVYTSTRHLNIEYICRINLTNKKIEYYSIDVKMINAICADETDLWIFALTDDGKTVLRQYDKLFKYCIREFELREIDPIMESGIMSYFRILFFQSKIFLFPSTAKKIYVYDIDNGTGHHIDYPKEIGPRDMWMTFADIQRKDSAVYLFPYGLKQLLKLDLCSESLSISPIKVDSETIITVLKWFNNNTGEVITEGFPITIKEFIRAI